MTVKPQCLCSPAPQDRKKRELVSCSLPPLKAQSCAHRGVKHVSAFSNTKLNFQAAKYFKNTGPGARGLLTAAQPNYLQLFFPWIPLDYHLQRQGFSFSQDQLCLLSTKGLYLWVNNTSLPPQDVCLGISLAGDVKQTAWRVGKRREQSWGGAAEETDTEISQVWDLMALLWCLRQLHFPSASKMC